MNNIWRMILIMVFSALFITIMVVVVFYFAILQPRAGVAVPELSGVSPEQAHIILKPKDLRLKLVGEEPSDASVAGMVLRQEPQAGVIVTKGGVISVWVSKGAERFIVPELAGFGLERARNQLEEMGLEIERVDSGFSDSLPKGVISATQPQAGVIVKKGDGIVITISQGRQEIVVPNLIGKRLEAAKEILTGLGFIVGKISYRVSTEYSPGRVTGQKPLAGTSLSQGDTVALQIATVLE